MLFILGAKGNEWAWRNKRWESVEHFQRVQQKWTEWGIRVVLALVAFGIVLAVAAGIAGY
jgi:membrane protein YqaA with SNARE-associated domain